MKEALLTILGMVISGVFGAGSILFFYKPNLKKANAEAKSVELENDFKAQDVYQELITDLTAELSRVRERQKNEIIELDERHQREINELELRITNMCSNCRYKKFFNEHEKK